MQTNFHINFQLYDDNFNKPFKNLFYKNGTSDVLQFWIQLNYFRKIEKKLMI